MDIIKIMITCLLCTIVIEVSIAFLLKIRDKKDILNVILVNILTNPLVVSISLYVNIKYGLRIRNIILIILELSAFITEGFIYYKVLKNKKINPFLISLILNLSSYFIGEIINSIMY